MAKAKAGGEARGSVPAAKDAEWGRRTSELSQGASPFPRRLYHILQGFPQSVIGFPLPRVPSTAFFPNIRDLNRGMRSELME